MSIKNEVMEEQDNTPVDAKAGQFGFNTAERLREFFHTRIGKSVEADIHKEIEEGREREILIREQSIQEEMKLLSLKIMAFIEEEEADKSEGREKAHTLEELNKEAIRRAEQPEKAKDRPHDDKKDIGSLQTVEDCNRQLAIVTGEEKLAQEQYDSYKANVKSINAVIAGFDPSSENMKMEDWKKATKETLNEKIEAFQKEQMALVEQSLELLEKGDKKSVKKGKELLEQAKDINIQIATLKDLKDVIDGKKEMYTADGQLAKNFSDAAFVVPADKKIVYDEKSKEYFLLDKFDKDGKVQELTAENRVAAKEAFEKQQQSLICVKDLIDSHCMQTMDEFLVAKNAIEARIKELKSQVALSPIEDQVRDFNDFPEEEQTNHEFDFSSLDPDQDNFFNPD